MARASRSAYRSDPAEVGKLARDLAHSQDAGMSDRSRIARRTPSSAAPAAPIGKTARRARAASPAPAPAPQRTLRARPRVDGAPVEAGPVVKWVGGKSKLLAELTARAPASFERYFEPFAGGAAVFFHLAPHAAVLADRNADLIATYRTVAADAEAVIARLAAHRRGHDEAHYYDVRARWNDPAVRWSAPDRAAAFIYLNKTCYNGLWRVNRGGRFNVPMGRYVSPSIYDPDELRAAGAALGRARMIVADYADAVADAGRGDFVYFDPPYHPVSATANFTSYTADAFGAEHQQALADTFRALAARGCAVMLSNSDTPFIRKLYRGFRIDRVHCARAINSNAASRGAVAEVLVSAGISA
jgi:DNA adenine methylase